MQNQKGKTQAKEKIDIKKIAIVLCLIVFIILTLLYIFDKSFYNKIKVFTFFKLKDSNISNAELSVHFIDVGQGDCCLIINKDKTVLVDTGDSVYSRKVKDYINAQNIDKLDYIIITHLHSDHAGGLFDIISYFNPSEIIIDTDVSDTDEHIDIDRLFSITNKGNITVLNPSQCKEIILPSANIEIFSTLSSSENLNEKSAVVKLTHKSNTFLLTGDIEEKGEKELADSSYDIDCDVLKVAHHGSSTSSGKTFLNKVSPNFCVISCGYDNTFNHPSEKTISALKSYTDNIFRTDLLGNIMFESDGTNLKYYFEKSD